MTAVTYNVASQPLVVAFGSTDGDTFTYDGNTGRMTTFGGAINGVTQAGTLTWNANGSLSQLAVTDPFNSANSQTCTYAHDDLSRIHQANCGSAWNQTFTFDAFGNLNKSGSVAWTPTYSVSSNRYASLPSGTPTYDANGNDQTDSFHTYTWDADGNMLSIDGFANIYDAFDRRVEQAVGPAQFLYGPDGAKFGVMSGQTVNRVYLPLPGGSAAVYSSSGLAYYRHSDWLGSARLASNPGRGLFYDKSFAPFGEAYNETGSAERSFTGQANNLTTGLDDFLFREYDPTQGRWLSPDPAGLAAVDPTNPQSWNRYGYVLGNPLKLVDPLGLDNDCGGPCFDFIYSSNGCTVSITYTNEQGVGGTYDIPHFSAACHQDQGATGGSTSGGGGTTQQTPPKTGTPQLYCEPDIIAGMKKIWMQSGNGMNGTEASFNVNGTPDNYSLFFNPFTNQQKSQSFRLQPNTFANFHVHPNSGSWEPSSPSNNALGNGQGDIGMANRTGIQIYVVSRQGLGFYDPKTKLAPVRLRPGMDWSKPCGG